MYTAKPIAEECKMALEEVCRTFELIVNPTAPQSTNKVELRMQQVMYQQLNRHLINFITDKRKFYIPTNE